MNKKVEFFRALKFLLISISAGLIQVGTFALFDSVFKWNYWVAYLLSLLLSIVWNFTINRQYTFKSASNIKVAMLLVLAFYAVFTPLSTWLGQVCESAGVNEYIVLAVTMILNFVLEFIYTRFFVYRNTCDTLKTKKEKSNLESNISDKTAQPITDNVEVESEKENQTSEGEKE